MGEGSSRWIVEETVKSIDEGRIVETTEMLARQPSTTGDERALADLVLDWGSRELPEATWTRDDLSEMSSSVLAWSRRPRGAGEEPAAGSVQHGPRELGFYAHLDTSFFGEGEQDALVTGRSVIGGDRFRYDAERRQVRGIGVGVAKGPAACALVAFGACVRQLNKAELPHRLSILLAAGGVHRSPPWGPGSGAAGGGARLGLGSGVQSALRRGYRPAVMVNVKAGASGVLYEEPGTVFLEVRCLGRYGYGPFRRRNGLGSGVVGQLPKVLAAIEEWGDRLVKAEQQASSQLSPEVTIGGLRGGWADKPDFMTGVISIYIDVVTVVGQDTTGLPGGLETWLAERCRDSGLEFAVTCYGYLPAGRTDPSAEVVQLAQAAWSRRVASGNDMPEIRGWTGSTDGSIFRAQGIDTVRLGIPLSYDTTDPIIEVADVTQMKALTETYVEVALSYVLAGMSVPRPAGVTRR